MSLAKGIFWLGCVVVGLMALWALGLFVKVLGVLFMLVSIPFTLIGHLIGSKFLLALAVIGLLVYAFRRKRRSSHQPLVGSGQLNAEMVSLEARLDRLNHSLGKRRLGI